jgi:hypothetical protein
MGSDARVYIFDHARFVTEVVPSLRTMLVTGDVPPDVASRWHQLTHEPLPEIGRADLARDCTYLRAELAYEHRIEHGKPWFDDWSERGCTSTACRSAASCPFHRNNPRFADEVNGMIAGLVADRCLGESQFLGRSVNVAFYRELLQLSPIAGQPALTHLVENLGRRGRVIGYLFGNSDGIHGWLDAAETDELAQRVARLELPQYEASFEAMERFRQRHTGPYGGSSFEPPPGYSFPQLSLSFVRTVASIAAQQGRGILWGNDLPGPTDKLEVLFN